jgi:hypothetical protein
VLSEKIQLQYQRLEMSSQKPKEQDVVEVGASELVAVKRAVWVCTAQAEMCY